MYIEKWETLEYPRLDQKLKRQEGRVVEVSNHKNMEFPLFHLVFSHMISKVYNFTIPIPSIT